LGAPASTPAPANPPSWLAPIVGGVLGALIYRGVLGVSDDDLIAPAVG